MNDGNTMTVYRDSQAIQNTYLNPETWGQMRAIADTLVRSQALPKDVKNAEQAMIKMQTGLEMGMTPMAAMQKLYMVNGSVLPWGAEIVNRLRQSGWMVSYSDETDESCTAEVYKKDRQTKRKYESYVETFTFDMAKQSGYVYQDEWKDGRKTGNKVLKVGWRAGANRKLKMRYNSLSMIIKSYIPEVLGGASEIADVAVDYVNVIDGEEVAQNDNTLKTKKKVEKVELTPELEKKRKEFFAVASEIGFEPEVAKEKIKKDYNYESFNDITLVDLSRGVAKLREFKAAGKKVAKKGVKDEA